MKSNVDLTLIAERLWEKFRVKSHSKGDLSVNIPMEEQATLKKQPAGRSLYVGVWMNFEEERKDGERERETGADHMGPSMP